MISTGKKDLAPLIMWLVLFAGIIALAIIRLNHPIGVVDRYPVYLDILFISFLLVWMIIELSVTKRDVKTDRKQTSDYMTCQLYGSGQASTIFSALWMPSVWQVANIAHIIGISAFLLGVGYRL